MGRLMNGRSAALALGAALILAADARAQAGIYELRCRGGEGMFAIDGPAVTGSDTMHLNFSPSSRAAGADGAGLDTGSCAWLDRQFREGEPSQIHFTTTGDVAHHLNDSTRYWGFWVFNTNQGYFEARRNQAAEPPPPPRPYQTEKPIDVATAPAKPDSALPPDAVLTSGGSGVEIVERPVDPVKPKDPKNKAIDQGPRKNETFVVTISKPKVTPIFRGAIIEFRAMREAAPIVTIGLGAAVRQPNGYLKLPTELTHLTPLRRSNSTGKVADYMTTSGQLEQGKTYGYVISVPAPIPEGQTSSLPYQKTGTFTTLGRKVRVVVTHITVQSDSDEDGTGELDFSFAANPGEPSHGSGGDVGSIMNPIDWESGTRKKVNVDIAVQNAPDRLRLLVHGSDNDSHILDRGYVRKYPSYESALPGFDQGREWNYAKGEFDLSRMPTNGETVPFTLRSLPSTNPRTSLAFDVTGYIEVSQ